VSSDASYLLVKRGLYYAPHNKGYTGVKELAGRYLAVDARPDAGVTAVHEDDAPEFSQACWPEVARDHLAKKVNRIRSYLELRDTRLLCSDGPARDTHEGCEAALRDVYLMLIGEAPTHE